MHFNAYWHSALLVVNLIMKSLILPSKSFLSEESVSQAASASPCKTLLSEKMDNMCRHKGRMCRYKAAPDLV